MSETPPLLPSEDAAWVRIATPLSVNCLREFCRDLERLYRINPQLEFAQWRQISSNHYYFLAKNLSNNQNINTELFRHETNDGFKISYHEGLKTATYIKIEKNEEDKQGSVLVLIDDYSGLPETERSQRLAEVDSSLTHWANELYRYLQNWRRWNWLPPYRWYMRHIWQPMKPTARRITYMLIIITLFELLALLAIAGILI